jgi:hypothetical protein
MEYNEHTLRLLHDADDMLRKYLKEDLNEKELQNSIGAIGEALEGDSVTNIRDSFLLFTERLEEIIFMEFPKKRRKLIEVEIEKLRVIMQLTKNRNE